MIKKILIRTVHQDGQRCSMVRPPTPAPMHIPFLDVVLSTPQTRPNQMSHLT